MYVRQTVRLRTELRRVLAPMKCFSLDMVSILPTISNYPNNRTPLLVIIDIHFRCGGAGELCDLDPGRVQHIFKEAPYFGITDFLQGALWR